jgi:hypothetical protein
MTSAPTRELPREIVVEKISDGIRYRLPFRRIGLVRLVGLLPLAFGVGVMLFPILGFRPFLNDALTKPHFIHLFILLFLTFWCWAAFAPVKIGLLILCSRCKVELTRDWLRAVDYFGPVRITRRARREDITSFTVDVANDKPMPRGLSFVRFLNGLEAKFEDAKAMPIVVAYPREWLLPLGDALSDHINEERTIHAHAPLPATTEETKSLTTEKPALVIDDVTTQPKSSRVRVDQSPDAITLTVPPLGLFRGSKGLFFFAVVWCAFMAIITAGVCFSKVKGSITPFLIIIPLFWLIGIGLMLGAINMGRRRALLIVSTSDLRIAQETLFGKKAWAWSGEELRAVRIDRSGMEVNYRPVLELQIHPATGKKVGLFAGRDELELQWLATVLRQRLNLPAR